MITIVCKTCNEHITGQTEAEAEIKWSAHKCAGFRDPADLPFDLLRKVAYGEMTEAEAWLTLAAEAWVDNPPYDAGEISDWH